MHLVCLGIMTKLLALWLQGPVTNRYHLHQSDVEALDKSILATVTAHPVIFNAPWDARARSPGLANSMSRSVFFCIMLLPAMTSLKLYKMTF